MGRGVKEKDLNRNMKSTSSGIGMSTDSDDIMSDDTSVGVSSAVQEVPKYFPPLSTPVTMADNASGKTSYAIITGKPSGKKVNVRTLFTPGGNGIDVVVLVDSIRTISERLLIQRMGDVRSSLDFYMKFYNSLGRAPNHCSSIGKTQEVVNIHLGNRLGRLDYGLTEF
uniref:Uncharacterized protein n=1 Tax=Tanacetum cinerariifolium TaxID=118510 RepID=A0A699KSN2_TANCI|nr:hypothetical protein [Tanacetum cinerariifolium]